MTSAPTRRRLALASALVAVGVLGSGAVAAVAATPSPPSSPSESPSVERAEPTPVEEAPVEEADEAAEAERKAERSAAKAERKAERSAAKAERKAERPTSTGPAFVCDPALSHGQNVSAYARSLPKGQGRGRLVSQAARSDCGKTPSDD